MVLLTRKSTAAKGLTSGITPFYRQIQNNGCLPDCNGGISRNQSASSWVNPLAVWRPHAVKLAGATTSQGCPILIGQRLGFSRCFEILAITNAVMLLLSIQK